jgi:CheY-like chemotaxis protein
MEKVKGLRILLVENDEMNIKFVKIVLDRLGHKTDIAVNGQLGVSLFKKNKYDLVLMDLEMPELNGLDAAVQIREYETKNNLNPAKIIAVTAYAMETDRQSCFEAGMDDFLAKPFLVEELTNLIEKYFSNNKEFSTNKALLNGN